MKRFIALPIFIIFCSFGISLFSGFNFSRNSGIVLMDENSQVELQNELFSTCSWFTVTKTNSGFIPAGTITFDSASEAPCELVHTIVTHGIPSLLTDAPLTSDFTIHQSQFIHPGQAITIAGNLTLDGNGASLLFANQAEAQFIVQQGYTVILKNIDFKNVNANTFNLGFGSKIKIGEEVFWELTEDLIFNHGSIEIEGTISDPNVFHIYGKGGIRRLTFDAEVNPLIPAFDPGSYRILQGDKSLDLGVNTLCLKNILLTGVDDIKRTPNVSVLGSIGLCGNAIVNIENNNDLGYVVEGVDNEIRLTANNVSLSGALLFGDYFENELSVNASLQSRLVDGAEVKFGDNFLTLASTYGHAALRFADNRISINNQYADSFVFGDYAFLDGQKVAVNTHPIQQISNAVELGRNLELEGDQSNAIVFGAPFTFRVPSVQKTTALHIRRQKECRKIDEAISRNKKEFLKESIKRRLNRESKIETTHNVPKVGPVRRSIPFRSVTIPADVNIIYNNTVKLGAAAGVIITQDATITSFGVDKTEDLSLTMEGNSVLEQGEATTVKSTDEINIVGSNNKILIRDSFVLEGSLNFANNAELIIEFDETAQDATFTFSNMNQVDVEPNSHLEFKGRGTVYFSDGTVINLKGTASTKRPEFVVNNSAVAQVMGDVSIQGYGRIRVDNGGAIEVGADSHLKFGNLSTDNLDIIFDRLAYLYVGGFQSKVSLYKCTGSVLFDNAALLSVGDSGVFEVNVLNGVISAGIIESFVFDNDARLRVNEAGSVLCANNSDGSVVAWSHKDGFIRSLGDGGVFQFVESPAPSILFQGRVADATTLDKTVYLMDANISFSQVIQAFLQRQPTSLRQSTLFYDVNSDHALRTKAGNMYALALTDVVEEDANGNAYINGYLAE